MSPRAFRPTPKTKKTLNLTTGAAATKLTDHNGECQVRIRTLSANTVDAYLCFGDATVVADATLDNGFAPGSSEVFTVSGSGAGIYVSGVTASGTAVVEVSIGSGL